MHSIELTSYKILHTVSFPQKFGKLAQDVLENPVTYQYNLSQEEQQIDYSFRLAKGYRFDHILHHPWFLFSLGAVTFKALPGCMKCWRTPSNVMIYRFTHAAAYLMAYSTLRFWIFWRPCCLSVLWTAFLPLPSKSISEFSAGLDCFFCSGKKGFWSLPMLQWALVSRGD